jgi:hypothetical protein
MMTIVALGAEDYEAKVAFVVLTAHLIRSG